MKPRERAGHCSIANAAPAGHSAPHPISKPARGTCTNEPHPQGNREYRRHLCERHVKFLCDGHHDEQEYGEVESVERPAEPCGPPGEPLVFGRFPPPENRTGHCRGHCLSSPLWLLCS